MTVIYFSIGAVKLPLNDKRFMSTQEQLYTNVDSQTQPTEPNRWAVITLVIALNLAGGLVFLSRSWETVTGTSLATICGW